MSSIPHGSVNGKQSPGPYARAAETYLADGLSPIPVGRDKMPMVAGYHGRKGSWVTEKTAKIWLKQYGKANVAIRLPKDIICLDIDDYEGHDGGNTLDELSDSFGPLPATMRSSARLDEGISGIRWFRIPERYRELDWPGVAGPGIDIITWFERYVIVPPSLHKNGHRYEWFDERIGALANGSGLVLGSLPMLPDAWCDHLAHSGTSSARVEFSGESWRDWLESYAPADDIVCELMSDTQQRWTELVRDAESVGGVHDHARDGIKAILGDCASGHTGAWSALGKLRTEFLRASATRGRRRAATADGEWKRMLAGAVEIAAAAWQDVPDQCAELAEFYGPDSADARRLALLSNVRDGKWLDEQRFAPLKWAVPLLVPEGMTLLTGAPKIGKSLLLLRFGLECARGGIVLGEQCMQMYVHYLALEDSDRRMQARCWELLGDDEIPANFNFQIETLPGKLMETIDAAFDSNGPSLILVDTLGKAMEPPKRGETTYDRDYRIASMIKSRVDAHDGSFAIVSHHTRKSKSDDWLDAVSGTNAISGCADTIIMLVRKHGEKEGIMHITGREVEEASYGLQCDRPFGWQFLDGDDDMMAAAASAQGILGSGNQKGMNTLGVRSMAIIDFVNNHPNGVTVDEVADAVKTNSVQARQYLNKLHNRGDIERLRRGIYGPVGKIRRKK